jgi:hypothetical protein
LRAEAERLSAEKSIADKAAAQEIETAHAELERLGNEITAAETELKSNWRLSGQRLKS